ncbi:hypothetical protein IGK74_002447 [Enterococcus sp. AZ150]|uniref:response regulator transcription factor n=1 Tax=Enterococcus sp. AZ150 TaxID=2774866 RepID=UPI003F299D21
MKSCLIVKKYKKNTIEEKIYVRLSKYYKITIINSLSQIFSIILKNKFDLIIFDSPNPISKLSLFKKIKNNSQSPILLITETKNETILMRCLLNGIDEYVINPSNEKDLLIEIKDLIDLNLKKTKYIFHYKNITLNMHSLQIFSSSGSIKLFKKEAEILKFLFEHPNKIYTRKELYTRIWNQPYYNDNNTINVHIFRLRKKIQMLDSRTNYIVTGRGQGIYLSK